MMNNNSTADATQTPTRTTKVAEHRQSKRRLSLTFNVSTKSIVKQISRLTKPATTEVKIRKQTSPTSCILVARTEECPPAPVKRQLSRHDKSTRNIVAEFSPRKLSRRFSGVESLKHTKIVSNNMVYRRRMDAQLLPALMDELRQSTGLVCNLPNRSTLKLTDMGTATIIHHDNTFCTVVEVPPRGESLFLYSTVWKSYEPSIAMMQKALELNYLGQGTNGATVALDPTCNMERDGMEYTLTYSHPMAGIGIDEFCQAVMNFMYTTKEVHEKLADVA